MTPLELLKNARIVPVLRGSNPDTVVEIAKVLHAEGFKTLEVAFTIPETLRVIAELAKLEGAVVGAGTVWGPVQLEAAVESGATFAVSPGIEARLLEAAKHSRVPFYPGVFSASEVMQARMAGFTIMKLFPGETAGVKHLKALRGPFPDIDFMPTGGVSADNLRDWFAAGAVAVGMGGSLVGDTPKATLERCQVVKGALAWMS